MNLRARCGLGRRISRSRGTAPSSPSWMRAIRALSSFTNVARFRAGDSGRVFSSSPLSVATPQSPFSAVVLPVSGGDERRPDERLHGVAQFHYLHLQGLHSPPLLFPRLRCFFPHPAIFFIESRRRFRQRAVADVLLDHTAAATHAPIVVAAPAPLLPGHVTNRYESGASDET